MWSEAPIHSDFKPAKLHKLVFFYSVFFFCNWDIVRFYNSYELKRTLR
jgi:hypothetical protein